MKIFLMLTILFLAGCQNNSSPAENASIPSNDSLDVQNNNEVPSNIFPAAPGAVLFETNKILDDVNNTDNCQFEYAENNDAPDVDPIGEISTMMAKIDEKEANDLIQLFYKKCSTNTLEKLSNNDSFWLKGLYDLEAFFNKSNTGAINFICIIRGNNRYAYYTLSNP